MAFSSNLNNGESLNIGVTSRSDAAPGHRGNQRVLRSLTNRGSDESSSGSTQSRDNESSSGYNDPLPPSYLPPATRPIDLTTDHSADNPAEATAVLRRCNNAPRAISADVGDGIKFVAFSLAVTRALGDAYLKNTILVFHSLQIPRATHHDQTRSQLSPIG